MTCVVAHPTNADEIWAGAAGGGVWHSEDAGRTWAPLWHQQHSLNVGALAIDPNAPAILYCGTGEANLSADSYPGVGIYKSTNGGRTWRHLVESTLNGIPARIGAIAIDPHNTNHILVGGVGHYFPNQPRTGGLGGLYESTDAGETWSRFDFISASEYR